MAKKTRKRVRNNKDRPGCMWGFINIFESRHGRSTHKLLADRKHESRRITGATRPSSELDKAEDVIVGEQYEKTILDKLSVKSLMMEEMFEHMDSEKQGHERKKSWHGIKKSFYLNDVDSVSGKPTHRKYKSLSSLEVTGTMEDLSSHVHVKAAEDSSVEERLGEATRVFVRHFADGRNTEEGKMKPSREVTEALHILNSNKDMFLKLLRDPSSELVKHLESLEDNPFESDSIDHAKSKNHGFFRRKLKGLDRSSSKKSEFPQDLSTIVILKPGNGSTQSSPDIRIQDQDEEKGSFRFSLTELTRKLKLTMRKENAHMDNASGDSLEMSSGHLDIKELPKSSTPEQRISSIYTEAKKHLAEIVGNGDEDADFLSSQNAEPLGRMLSYSNCDISQISSPPKGKEQIADQPVQEEGSRISSPRKGEEQIADQPVQEEGSLEETRDEIRAEDELETQNQISSLEQRNRIEPDDFEEEKISNDVVINEPASSPSASSSSSVCSTTENFEDQEAISDKSERPSPVSVLEPIFIDEDDSPSSIKSFSVSEYIQPRQIKFDDQVSRAPSSRTWEEEKKAVFEFVEAVAQASALTRDQLLERFLFSENLLDPSLFEHVRFHPDCIVYDPKLLFDLVHDVLAEVCDRDFDGITSLYSTLTNLTRRNLVDEIRQGIDWHLQSEHTERTLDQTVAKDFSKLWTWMDLRLDSERIGVEMGEDILDQLIEEILTSF